MNFLRLFLVVHIILSLPILVLSSIANAVVNVQVLTQFIHNGKDIYIYASKSNEDINLNDCRKWQFYYVPAIEPYQYSKSNWIWIFKDEVRMRVSIGNNLVQDAAKQAISKKYGDDIVKRCQQSWDIMPLMIESLRAYIVNVYGQTVEGALPFTFNHLNSRYIVFRFVCNDHQKAEELKTMILDGSYEVRVFLQFDGFSTVKTNSFSINIEQLKSIMRKTIDDNGGSNTIYVYKNQADELVKTYLSYVQSIIYVENLKNNIAQISDELSRSLLQKFDEAVVQMKEIYLHPSEYGKIWGIKTFDFNRLSTTVNEVFKLDTKYNHTQYSNERYFIIDKTAIYRQTSSSLIAVRSFWKIIERYLIVMKLTETISQSQINTMLQEQSIKIVFEQDRLVLTTIGVMKIVDVITRMQTVILSQHFTVEQQKAEITRTISATDLENYNDTFIYDRGLESESSLTILPPVDSIFWNCTCPTSRILMLNTSLVDTEVGPGENTTFTLTFDSETKPTVKWFFNNKQLQSSLKYKIENISNDYKLTIHNSTDQDVGRYHALVETLHDRLEKSATLVLKMKPEAIESFSSEKEYRLVGQNVKLYGKFRGIERPRVTWLFNNQSLTMNERINIENSDDQESILTIRNVKLVDAGVYTIGAVNSMGQTEIRTSLFVIGKKSIITIDLKNQTLISTGYNAKIELTAFGIPKPNIVWMRGNQSLAIGGRIRSTSFASGDEERFQLIIENVQRDDQDEYWAKLENQYGVTHSGKCHLSIIQKIPQIPSNSTWSQNATTIITGLSHPHGLALDQDNGTVYVADNQRIISWNPNTDETNVILSNLEGPRDVLIDKETKSIIIADRGNKRVLRCSLENGKNQVEKIIANIGCWGLTMDNEGSLYVCDYDKHEVRKFPRGEKTGILVAGGNGKGNGNHQLSYPHYIALDDEGSLYVSDYSNHRVMKWKKEAKEGITVAGGNGEGSNNNQLYYPTGIVVDSNGNIYVAEGGNNRVTRWRKGEKTGEILVGGNGMNQLNYPVGLSFDRQNNIYVVDRLNNRVQRFSFK